MLKLNIIIISYYAFPYTAISALRISHLANYLSEKGHSITFIRADNKYYKNLIDYKLKLNEKIKQIHISIKPTTNPSLSRLRFTFEILKKIKKLITNNKFDFLFFCSDPFWYLPLGPIFKIFYKIPYIIDFRDIMYRHPIFRLHKYKDFMNKIADKFLEEIYIKYADLVIDVTEENTILHRKIYSKYPSEKFITIANGYDSKLIGSININTVNETTSEENSLKNKIINQKLKLAISGKFAFYNVEDVNIIIELEKMDINIAKNLEIIAIGKDNPIFKEKAANAKYLTFTFYPQMSQIDAFNILNESDILLLNNSQKTALGTKIFDYIGLNKPIFAFVKQDYAIWKLLEKFENAFLIKSVYDLIKAINQVLLDNIIYLTKNLDLIAQYSRENQYEKLENILRKKY